MSKTDDAPKTLTAKLKAIQRQREEAEPIGRHGAGKGGALVDALDRHKARKKLKNVRKSAPKR
jgi:hypothetical protein